MEQISFHKAYGSCESFIAAHLEAFIIPRDSFDIDIFRSEEIFGLWDIRRSLYSEYNLSHRDKDVYRRLSDNPTSNLLVIVAVVTLLRQCWDILYQIVIILYRCCNDCKTDIRRTSQTASVHIVKFLNESPGSVRLYATLHILTCITHIDVYNLDIHIRTYTPV